MTNPPRNPGFTLIELMIVVAVVAILATIALPAYTDAVRKSRRADAQSVLSEMAIRQEKWRANNTTYSSTGSEVGAPPAGSRILSHYTITTVGTASTYSVTATPIGGQANDTQSGTACNPLAINQSGARTPAVCWER